MDQVVGRCQASLPCGEGLVAGTADDGATLCKGDGALANKAAEGTWTGGGGGWGGRDWQTLQNGEGEVQGL